MLVSRERKEKLYEKQKAKEKKGKPEHNNDDNDGDTDDDDDDEHDSDIEVPGKSANLDRAMYMATNLFEDATHLTKVPVPPTPYKEWLKQHQEVTGEGKKRDKRMELLKTQMDEEQVKTSHNRNKEERSPDPFSAGPKKQGRKGRRQKPIPSNKQHDLHQQYPIQPQHKQSPTGINKETPLDNTPSNQSHNDNNQKKILECTEICPLGPVSRCSTFNKCTRCIKHLKIEEDIIIKHEFPIFARFPPGFIPQSEKTKFEQIPYEWIRAKYGGDWAAPPPHLWRLHNYFEAKTITITDEQWPSAKRFLTIQSKLPKSVYQISVLYWFDIIDIFRRNIGLRRPERCGLVLRAISVFSPTFGHLGDWLFCCCTICSHPSYGKL